MNKSKLPTILTVVFLSLGMILGIFLLKGGFNNSNGPKIDDAPQNVSVSEVRSTQSSVSWITADRAPSTIYFGITSALGDIKTSPGLTTAHLVTLDNILPDTTYYVMIGAAAGKYATDGINGAVPYTLHTLAAIPETDNSALNSTTPTQPVVTPTKQLALAGNPSPFGEVLKNGGGNRPLVLAEATTSGSGTGSTGSTGTTGTTGTSGTGSAPNTASPLYTLLVVAISLSLFGFGLRLLKR